MSESSIIIEKDNHVATVSINRPGKSNALDMDSWNGLRKAFSEDLKDPRIRVVILAGEGWHFCAGIDLGLLAGMQKYTEDESDNGNEKIYAFIRSLQDCITAIENCNKPVIAAVHNGCIGAGLDIITACDLRYCSADAFFSIRETAMGLVADLGTLQRLPKIIPAAKATEMAFTGRDIPAEEAKGAGLVLDIFDDRETMMRELGSLALEIAGHSPRVLSGIKQSLLHARDHTVSEGLEWIARYNSRHLDAADIMESITARMEKRKPVYPE